ncbi:MAG: NAD+ synthase [Gammaproteobacteria bacterium]|nr:MAG: NAD+ synthase [Gammaproteobacteria bacterium]
MSASLRIVMAQLNLLVGDVAGNAGKIVNAIETARDELMGDVLVTPELALSGYPPEDLLFRPDFNEHIRQGLDTIRQHTSGIDVVVGYPQQTESGYFNAVSVIRNGDIIATYHKQYLPNYSVFDEKRYFTAGDSVCLVDIKGIRVALSICEDVWMSGPVTDAAQAGAQLILNLNASPYHVDKDLERQEQLRLRVKQANIPIVYVNLVGGQDELVFDGASMVMDGSGNVSQIAPAFEEGLYVAEFGVQDGHLFAYAQPEMEAASQEQQVYRALVLGVQDYIEKNRFSGVVIGLSGGIDSALTLAVAVDAIGTQRVEAVSMPSRYTADMSIEDARAEADALGVNFSVLPIEAPFETFLETLSEEFSGLEVDVTEENLQARCRGVILMAIANKKCKIVLTTGNKSEMAVGYATLYGDMAGGFAVLKDVPKTLVYRLARYRNSIADIIPERVITRPPSAELAVDQKDEDSLPPYDVLDPILEMYVEQDLSVEDIVTKGYDSEVVRRVISMVERNEYKRRQAAPGVRISRRAFGRDRRYPITSGYIVT